MMIKPEGIKLFFYEFDVFSQEHKSLRLNESKKHFEQLFSKFKLIDQIIKTKNKETSYQFNPLSFFEIGENKMSELLAFLLNPNASSGHGQGIIYLQEFCKQFKINGSFQDVFVATEHLTDENRRIDIFIKIDDSYIVIENKYMWAVDQPNQLDDYFDYAKNKNPQFDGHNVYCFYLTPDKKIKGLPQNKIPLSNLKIIDFKFDIFTYLSKCREISNNKMQLFIDSLISRIKKDILKEDKMDQYQKEIYEWLAEDASRVEYAQQVFNIWEGFRISLLEETAIQLSEKMKHELNQLSGNDEDWMVMRNDNLRNKYTGIIINKKQWGGKYALSLINEYGSFNGIFLIFGNTHANLLEEEKNMGTMIAEKINGKADSTKPEVGIAWKWSDVKDTWIGVDRFSRNKRATVIDTWTNELMSFINVLEQNDIKKKIIDLVSRINS